MSGLCLKPQETTGPRGSPSVSNRPEQSGFYPSCSDHQFGPRLTFPGLLSAPLCHEKLAVAFAVGGPIYVTGASPV